MRSIAIGDGINEHCALTDGWGVYLSVSLRKPFDVCGKMCHKKGFAGSVQGVRMRVRVRVLHRALALIREYIRFHTLIARVPADLFRRTTSCPFSDYARTPHGTYSVPPGLVSAPVARRFARTPVARIKLSCVYVCVCVLSCLVFCGSRLMGLTI